MRKSKKIKLSPGVFPAEYVEQRMEHRGVTRRDLCLATGRSKQTVSTWLHERPEDRTPPKAKDLAVIAQLLEINGGALLGIEHPRTVRY